MSENPERNLPLRESRPKAAGHVWAWIIVAVGSVIFLAIALWVIVAGNTQIDAPSDHDNIHAVSSRWAERWAQAPGPPSAYLDSANQAVKNQAYGEAMRYTAMALALDPDDTSAWYRALCLSVVVPGHAMAVSEAEWEGVWGALAGMDGSDPGLADLKIWRASGGVKMGSESALPPFCAQTDASTSPKTERQTLDTTDASP